MDKAKLLASSLALLLLVLASPTSADTPTVKIKQATHTSLVSAQSYFGSSLTHTKAPDEVRHQEIVELANSLRGDIDLIYRYVHDNVETIPAFGLKNGALGALIDGSGTPLDQAELFVELARAAGYSARYRVGSATMDQTKFLEVFGSNKEAVACRALRDGGFAYDFLANGSTNCTTDYDDTSFTLMFHHVWVEVNIDGTYYTFDPSMKKITSSSGIDLSSAMGVSGAAAVTISNFTNDAGVNTVGCVTATCAYGVNDTNIDANLNWYSNNLESTLELEVNHGKNIADIIGGFEIDDYANDTTRDTSLSYLSVQGSNNLWSGDVPDQYRTKITFKFSGNSESAYLDQIYGRKLWLNKSGDYLQFIIGNRVTASYLISGTSTYDIEINHPYAASSGLYADHTEKFNYPFRNGTNAAIVLSGGATSKGLLHRYYHDHYQSLSPLNASASIASSDAQANAQLGLAANWLAQSYMLMRMNDGVNDMNTVRHHSVGLITGDSSTGIKPIMDIRDTLSVTDMLHTGTRRTAGIQALTSAMAALEGAVIDQTADAHDAEPSSDSAIHMMTEVNDSGRTYYDVDTVTEWDTLVNYPLLGHISASDRNKIRSQIANGYRVLIPDTSVSAGALSGFSYLTIKGDEEFGHNIVETLGLTADSHLKGAMMQEFIADPDHGVDGGGSGASGGGGALPAAMPGGGLGGTSSVSGSASLIPSILESPKSGGAKASATDLVIGNGAFPNSLAFSRYYYPDSGNTAGGQWSHNWEINGRFRGDAYFRLGGSKAIDAAPTIVALYVAREILANGHNTSNIIINSHIAFWLQRSLYNNVFTVSQGGSNTNFVKLAGSNGWSPPEGTNVSSLSVTGTGSSTEAVYTTKSGVQMTFKHADSNGRKLKLSNWNFPAGATVTMTYPNVDQIRVENHLGNYLIINRHSTDKYLLDVADSAGRTLTYAYTDTTGNGNYNIENVTLSHGANSEYLYDYSYNGDALSTIASPDAVGALVDKVTYGHNALEQSNSVTYTDRGTTNVYQNGWRLETVDSSGASQITLRDRYGRWIETIDGLGNVTTVKLDRLGRTIEVIAPEGNGVQYTWNKEHNKTSASIVDKSGANPITTSFSYHGSDKYFQLSRVTDPSGNYTDFDYATKNDVLQKRGLVLSTTLPAASVDGGASQTAVTHFNYTTFGNLWQITTPDSIVTTMAYGGTTGQYDYGLLKSVQADSGGYQLNSAFTYDSFGNLNSTTDHRGNISNSYYDMYRRPYKTEAPGNAVVTEYDYDDAGRLKQTKIVNNDTNTNDTDGYHSSLNTYDEAGRLKSTTHNDGTVTYYDYDDVKRELTVTDPVGRKVRTAFNANGQTIRIDKAYDSSSQTYGISEYYYYNPNGTLDYLQDGRGNQTHYDYDGYDRLIKTTFPDGSTEERIAFDSSSRPTTTKTRSGTTITLTYDARGRIVTRTVSGASTQYYYYTNMDQIKRVVKGSSTVSYTYDNVGRVKTETTLVGGTNRTISTNYYDSTGQSEVIYDGGYYVTYAMDALNRLSTITENGTTTLATYTYDDLSRLKTLSFGNGANTAYHYKTQGSLHSIAQAGLSTGYNTTLTYDRNNNGQITQVTSTESGYIWKPDFSNTLANVSYASNNLNQYTSVGLSTLSYDANGNLTADWQFTYSYDAENNLTQATDIATGTVVGTYAYDPLGRRARKVATFSGSNTTTDYLWSGSSVMAEYDGSGLLLRRYVYGAGIDTPLVMVDNLGSKTYLHSDAMGSIIAVSNTSGSGLDKFTYGPFGEGASETNSSYKYTARRLDEETGNYYYRARYYHAKLGRFMSPDPIGYGDGLNMYAYVGNDPLNWLDPFGTVKCRSKNKTEDPKEPCPENGTSGNSDGYETENIPIIGVRVPCNINCQAQLYAQTMVSSAQDRSHYRDTVAEMRGTLEDVINVCAANINAEFGSADAAAAAAAVKFSFQDRSNGREYSAAIFIRGGSYQLGRFASSIPGSHSVGMSIAWGGGIHSHPTSGGVVRANEFLSGSKIAVRNGGNKVGALDIDMKDHKYWSDPKVNFATYLLTPTNVLKRWSENDPKFNNLDADGRVVNACM